MIDPSLAVASLGIFPKELMLDIRTFGLLFENLVNRDLSVYVNTIGGSLKHYRDRYALVETKLGRTRVDEAEKHLLDLKTLIEDKNPKIGKPEFLMVITGTDMAYTTLNGVFVVSNIGCLKN